MPVARTLMNAIVRTGTSVLCRIERDPLEQIPRRGPLILVANHIGSLEVPLLFVHLQPRRLIGLAKIETWDNRLMGWLFDLWEAIPIRRGEPDVEAIRRCLAVLDAGDILAVAPEGTRSRTGRLLRAQPGIAMLALRSGAPLLPIGHWGGEQLTSNLRRLRRTHFHVRVGRPFIVQTNGERVTAEVRQTIADEIMAQVAALMPERYRGAYADWVDRPPRYLKFID